MRALMPGFFVGVLVSVLAAAPLPWRGKDPQTWTSADVQRLLSDSPWSQTVGATFPETRTDEPASVYSLPGPAEAGMKGGKNGATDGRWDGGVSRNTGAGMLPTLSVRVRWESALPVRRAILRAKTLGMPDEGDDRAVAEEESKSYVISVFGLVPANQYGGAGTLQEQSSSQSLDGTRAPLDTEHVLEGLMSSTRLAIRGRKGGLPEDVKLDPKTGMIRIFFPKSLQIQKSDREVYFSTRFGSLNLEKRFRLSDLMYQGQLEL